MESEHLKIISSGKVRANFKMKNSYRFMLLFLSAWMSLTINAANPALVDLSPLSLDSTAIDSTNIDSTYKVMVYAYCDTLNSAKGSVSAIPTNGVGPYTYLWSTGATGDYIAGISNGNYAVTVTDATGKTSVGSITLNCPFNPLDTLNQGDSSLTVNMYSYCDTVGLPKGSVYSYVTGGTPPYNYSWSNGSSNSSIYSVVNGSYTLTVTDSKNDSRITSVSLNCSNDSTGTKDSTNVISASVYIYCDSIGSARGTIYSAVSGGTAPYTYSWSNGSTAPQIYSLANGGYTLTVTDANNNTSIQYANVSCNDSTNVIDSTNTLVVSLYTYCDSIGAARGLVYSMVNGGVAPYTYSWSNGSTAPQIYSLANGSYALTVKDANNNTAVQYAYVYCNDSLGGGDSTNTLVVSLNTYCKTTGSARGSVYSAVSGGTAPYTYSWSNGSTDAQIYSLLSGVYGLTVTDAKNGISVQYAFVYCNDSTGTLDSTKTLTVSLNTYCDTVGSAKGSIYSAVNGGTAPYTYSWSNGSTDPQIYSLANGIYVLTVTDANNNTSIQYASVSCSDSTSVIDSTNTLSVSVYSYCDTLGLLKGSIYSTVSGGTPPYNYSWSTGSTSQSIYSLVNGTYTLTVTDANNNTAVNYGYVSCSDSTSGSDTTALSCKAVFSWYIDSTDSRKLWIVNESTAPDQIWFMGDGSTIVGPIGSYTYADTGSYTICLRVTDSINMCTGFKCLDLSVFKIKAINQVGIIKKTDVTGINLVEKQKQLDNLKVYPNPANGLVNISYELADNSNVSLTVFDLIGNKVIDLENKYKQAGQYQTQFNTSELNNGVYFVQLTKDGKMSTTRLVVAK